MRTALLLLVPAGLVPAGLVAQQAPTVRLDKPLATLPAEWTSVAGVRELRDGRVIVLDYREQVVKLADFAAGSATLVGAKGSGPGEYVMPTGLYALPGDSSLVYDEANFRGVAIDGRGKPTGILTISVGNGPRPFIGAFGEVDAAGRAYAGSPQPNAAGDFPIERLDRASGKLDTVGFFSRKNGECAVGRGGSGPPARGATGVGRSARGGGSSVPFVAIEEWAVSSDGRVAVVCANPYRVRIRAANGAMLEGPAIPYDRVKITSAEKEAWRAERAEPVATIRFGPGGTRSAGFEKPRVQEPDEWPDQLPPFTTQRTFRRVATFSPDGMLWIRRATAANAPPQYDVIGRDAKLAYRVTMPPRTRIVGFGQKGIYAIQMDDDDLERLQVYRLPANGR